MTTARLVELLKAAGKFQDYQRRIDALISIDGLAPRKAAKQAGEEFHDFAEQYAKSTRKPPPKSARPPKVKRPKPKFEPVLPTEAPPVVGLDVVRDYEWVYSVIGLPRKQLEAVMGSAPSGGSLALLKWAQENYSTFMTNAIKILHDKKKADSAGNRAQSVEYQNKLIETALETARRDAGVASRYDEADLVDVGRVGDAPVVSSST